MVNDYVEQGMLIQLKDNEAIAAGAPYILPEPLRSELNVSVDPLKAASELAETKADQFHNQVTLKRAARRDADIARRNLQSYVKAVHNKTKAKSMFVLLNLDKPFPTQDSDIVASLTITIDSIPQFDPTPDKIPIEYYEPLKNARDQFHSLFINCMVLRGEVNNAYQRRNTLHHAFGEILSRIRVWLISKLPLRDKDEKLLEYGFDPREDSFYPTPEMVTEVVAAFDAAKNQIAITWVAATDANDYEIFSAFLPEDDNVDPIFKRMTKTNNLFYYVHQPLAGKTYLFQVRGVTHFRKGEFSDIVEVELPNV